TGGGGSVPRRPRLRPPPPAGRLRLDPGGADGDRPAHGGVGQGARRLHGRRHAPRSALPGAPAAAPLLPAALRPGDEPAHRPPAEGAGVLPDGAVGPAAEHLGGGTGPGPGDRAAGARADGGADGLAAAAGAARAVAGSPTLRTSD